MDQSFAPQHSCDAMTTAIAPTSSCAEVAGVGVTGIIIVVVIVLGLGLVGYLLWRRMRNRME
ncbi:MAG: hypothetical protein WC876_03525 [Candidatus Thermoplasmatota archaeon]|jgi:hypothetical protein